MSDNKNRIEIITLGCSKNVVDSERLARQLTANNFEITNTSENSDSIIINTCGFIDAAKEESINTILHAVNLKKQGKVKKIVVAGCLSERFMDELKNEITDVDVYFGTEDYEGIVKEFGGNLKKELLGERELTTPKHFAYLKISEGCGNNCSYCVIPKIRGALKSRKIDDVFDEAKKVTEYFNRRLPQTGKTIELTVNGNDKCCAKMNSELFEWVLENLIKNALDAIENKNGKIKIDISENKKNIERIYVNALST